MAPIYWHLGWADCVKLRARVINVKTGAENNEGETQFSVLESLKITAMSALMLEDPFKFQVSKHRHAPKEIFSSLLVFPMKLQGKDNRWWFFWIKR